MRIRQRTLLAPLAIVLLGFTPSCKDRVTPSAAGTGEDPPPGAANNDPVIPEFAYKHLGYTKGIFTKDGIPFSGRAVQHYPDETLKSRYNFMDGLLDGLVEEWYENGQRSTYKLYKKGMRHGITTYWDENGTPTKQVLYRDDEEIEEKTGTESPKDTGQ